MFKPLTNEGKQAPLFYSINAPLRACQIQNPLEFPRGIVVNNLFDILIVSLNSAFSDDLLIASISSFNALEQARQSFR
jgi:hypothetical protein